MTNKRIPSVPADMGSVPSSLDDFNNADQLDWLVGVRAKMKGKIVAGYGSQRTLNSAKAYGAGTAKTTLFSTAKGWDLIQNNGTNHDCNIELTAATGTNRWCPASIFNGFGGQFKQNHNKTHSMYFTDLALVFHHASNDDWRYTTDGRCGNSKGIKTFYYRFSTQSYIDEIRSWGSDWLFYGVILRVANDKGALDDQSEVSCFNFRVFTKGSASGSANRLMCPAPRSDADRGTPIYGEP